MGVVPTPDVAFAPSGLQFLDAPRALRYERAMISARMNSVPSADRGSTAGPGALRMR